MDVVTYQLLFGNDSGPRVVGESPPVPPGLAIMMFLAMCAFGWWLMRL